MSESDKGIDVRTIHAGHQHMTWDNARTPAATVAPGETVAFAEINAVCGQLSPDSTPEVVANLDFDPGDPIVGPIYVDGAEPGDTIKAALVDLTPSGWAWTAIVSGFGLLAEDFPEPSLNIWSYDTSFREPAAHSGIARVPLKPFCGTIGLARAEAGDFSTVPPCESSGNMNIRDLTIGVDLYLPVQVAGRVLLHRRPALHSRRWRGLWHGDRIAGGADCPPRPDQVRGASLPALREAGPGLALQSMPRATKLPPGSARTRWKQCRTPCAA